MRAPAGEQRKRAQSLADLALRTTSRNQVVDSRNMTAQPYKGKLGIVTGGSRGIGAAVARRLARKGCQLVLVYSSASSGPLVESLCAELAGNGGATCTAVQADLSQPEESVPLILSAAKAHHAANPPAGRAASAAAFQIDILVNNAGVSSNQFLNDAAHGAITAAEFRRVYAVNVLAPLLLTQAVAPYLPRDRSGRIVNTSSVSASIGYQGQSVYAGSKAALEAMTRAWARELAARATVNVGFGLRLTNESIFRDRLGVEQH
ncbi:L-xylo-3-hexulose reductase [Ascosphaera acerosa]|nr:L-xylo-3-hexulose reductase [Ascosphaera acerosa]